MKSGWLTSLSAPALLSDVRVVRLRFEQGPPPCIQPLLIHPCSVRRAAFQGRSFFCAKGTDLLLVEAVLGFFVVEGCGYVV